MCTLSLSSKPPGAEKTPLSTQNLPLSTQPPPLSTQKQLLAPETCSSAPKNLPLGTQNLPLSTQNPPLGTQNQHLAPRPHPSPSKTHSLAPKTTPWQPNTLLSTQNLPLSTNAEPWWRKNPPPAAGGSQSLAGHECRGQARVLVPGEHPGRAHPTGWRREEQDHVPWSHSHCAMARASSCSPRSCGWSRGGPKRKRSRAARPCLRRGARSFLCRERTGTDEGWGMGMREILWERWEGAEGRGKGRRELPLPSSTY